MREDFLVFGSPKIERPEIDEVVACMESGWLGTGPKVARFEKDFAAYKGAEYAVALNSCTAALHLSSTGANGCLAGVEYDLLPGCGAGAVAAPSGTVY